jgi:hypothetical protein
MCLWHFLRGNLSSGSCRSVEWLNLKKLAVYEVPYYSSESGIQEWRAYRNTLSGLVEADWRADAMALFMKYVGVPDEMLEEMRQAPMWHAMARIAPTLISDAATFGLDRTMPTSRVSAITAPTLVMDGGESSGSLPFMCVTAEVRTCAIPNANHRVTEGQGHAVESRMLAPLLTAFFRKEKLRINGQARTEAITSERIGSSSWSARTGW